MQNLPISSASRHFRRRKVRPLDMTPMVGVGFLLVCFFLMASSFSRPTVMELAMPVKPLPDAPFQPSDCGCGGGMMTVLLGRSHQAWYYWGMLSSDHPSNLYQTDFSSSGLRQVLLQFRAAQGACGIVLIKTTDDANYQSLVDALDEMKITDQRRYMLVDLHPADRALLAVR